MTKSSHAVETKSADESSEETVLSELRETLAEAAGVLQERMARAQQQASATAAEYPWATVSLAAGLGLLAALAMLPRRKRASRTSWTDHLDLSRYGMPLASELRQLQAQMPSAEPLTSRLERVVDTISKMDPSVLSTPYIGKARDWLQAAFQNLRKIGS